MKKQKETDEIVLQLCEVLNKTSPDINDFPDIISRFLYSIGAWIENIGDINSEEVLKRYATSPSLGNALMAQAIHMKECWNQEERNNTNGKNLQG